MLTVTRFLVEENGQSLTEYALVLSLIVVTVVGILLSFGFRISNLFSNASAQINQ
ncbi:Flp family type IVb pilin [Thermincola potens]|uniref:Flp/Fap pilin component n=1 Tax=Thermincola potens (strain JR) TaxID=635013 RepID=D5XEL0_THEPJ|nr:Flp/Fap pilin component [Thermincola potens]ADG82081.1 Flp/Fap pilin component [Thermincola potens JR]